MLALLTLTPSLVFRRYRTAEQAVDRPRFSSLSRRSVRGKKLVFSASACNSVDRRKAPATALAADHLERLGVSYAGVFPNSRTDGDVLRMQTLRGARIVADDVSVASEHGRELLEYVLSDLA